MEHHAVLTLLRVFDHTLNVIRAEWKNILYANYLLNGKYFIE
jgi:hypothetical protein